MESLHRKRSRRGLPVTAKQAPAFTGTQNPRHLRAIRSLLVRSMAREALDRAAGCSSSPELVAELRRRGLEVPCKRVSGLDRDGRMIRRGVYSLNVADRRKLRRWMRTRGVNG